MSDEIFDHKIQKEPICYSKLTPPEEFPDTVILTMDKLVLTVEGALNKAISIEDKDYIQITNLDVSRICAAIVEYLKIRPD